MKLRENLEFSLTNVDKIFTKGFTNDSNCCFMNVCLQALLASPAYFNMLIAIGQNQEMFSQLSKTSLISKFVHLARYFNPRDQLDSRSVYTAKTISAEKIFSGLIGEFNPYHNHQDCHEFFSLLLDRLHEEMATVY
jgi:ubiquitin C-terminal hydrolase